MKVFRFRKQSKGFTLIEVIISMAILAIIVVPLLNYFVTSAQYNTRAKTKQNATVLAQSILEKCKDKSLEDIAKSFQTTADELNLANEFDIVDASMIGNHSSNVQEIKFGASGIEAIPKGSPASSYDSAAGKFISGNATDGILHYAVYNISEDGGLYDALISIDMNKDAGDTYGTINQTPLVDIKTLDSGNNVVAVESSQNDRALELMSSINLTECNMENEAHNEEVGYLPVTPATHDEIKAALHRLIVIDIKTISGGADPKATAQAVYKYYCPGILGCPSDQSSAIEIDPPLYSETISAENIENMYLFYSKVREEEKLLLSITDSNPPVIPNFNLYLLCQTETAQEAFTDSNYKLNIAAQPEAYTKIKNLYSNLTSCLSVNSVPITPKNYISTSTSIRMENLKIEIYKAGKLNDPVYQYVTLDSTKKE